MKNETELNEILENWIENHYNDSDCKTIEDFKKEMSDFFEENSSHISDCFVDTSFYCKNTNVTASELESAIIDYCNN